MFKLLFYWTACKESSIPYIMNIGQQAHEPLCPDIKKCANFQGPLSSEHENLRNKEFRSDNTNRNSLQSNQEKSNSSYT